MRRRTSGLIGSHQRWQRRGRCGGPAAPLGTYRTRYWWSIFAEPLKKTSPGYRRRSAQLSALLPAAAVRAWLAGDFAAGQVAAMISAIRKEPRITISDLAITDFMMNAMAKGWAVSTCLRRMIAASSD